jgi:hypothetical protein
MQAWNARTYDAKCSMMLDLSTWRWHRAIIKAAEKKLGRRLSAPERTFITSRRGGIALEMIDDTVRTSGADELASYLNSEENCGRAGS